MAINLRAGLPVVAALGMLASMQADANALTFTGSDATRSAQVDFTSDGLGNLFVTLTNTSLGDVGVPIDVLTGVFWAGSGALTPLSALLAAGSSVFQGVVENAPAGGNVGGEWAYKASIDGPGSSTVGMSHLASAYSGLLICSVALIWRDQLARMDFNMESSQRVTIMPPEMLRYSAQI